MLAITVGLASPSSELAVVMQLAQGGVTSFALELVPRISRAQSMDALSSQALGRLVAEIGVAPSSPLEYVMVRIARDVDGSLSVVSDEG